LREYYHCWQLPCSVKGTTILQQHYYYYYYCDHGQDIYLVVVVNQAGDEEGGVRVVAPAGEKVGTDNNRIL
jgi:hypothetical protein